MNRLIQGAIQTLKENPEISRVDVANAILDAEKELQELISIHKTNIDNKLYKNIAEVSLRVI